MATSNTVKLLDVCRVGPPPSSIPQTFLSLSFLDLFWFPLPPPQRLYFYEFPYSKTHFTDTFLPRIKHSLSLTLQHFYPFAGKLIWPSESEKPMVNYVDGDTLALTITESEDDFHRLSGDLPKDAKAAHPLVPHLQVTGDVVPVLALQITLFPNSGFSIGITTHHAVVDGKVATLFMKSWASVCKSEDTSLLKEMLPFYDKSVIKDPNGIEKIFLKDLVKFFEFESKPDRKFKVLKLGDLPPNMVRATFEFRTSDLENLKKWVLKKCENYEQISTFVVTCAYSLVCLIKAKRDISLFIIPADFRTRLNPPIPSNYFGNCIGGILVFIEGNDLTREDGLAVAVTLIKKAIKEFESDPFKGAEGWASSMLSMKSERQKPSAAAGSPRFRVYDTDFGWGKPKKVEMISIDETGAISFAENRDGEGGIEIGLVLNKNEMEVFASSFVDGLNAI